MWQRTNWVRRPTPSGPRARRLPKIHGWRRVAWSASGSARSFRVKSEHSCSTTRGYGTGIAGSYSIADRFGTETAEAALTLGVPPRRISAIAAGPNPPGGVRATGGSEAGPDALDRITGAILAGKITVPIAATFPIEQIHDAVALRAGRHVHGKIVVAL